jgi:hypothetical protein
MSAWFGMLVNCQLCINWQLLLNSPAKGALRETATYLTTSVTTTQITGLPMLAYWILHLDFEWWCLRQLNTCQGIGFDESCPGCKWSRPARSRLSAHPRSTSPSLDTLCSVNIICSWRWVSFFWYVELDILGRMKQKFRTLRSESRIDLSHVKYITMVELNSNFPRFWTLFIDFWVVFCDYQPHFVFVGQRSKWGSCRACMKPMEMTMRPDGPAWIRTLLMPIEKHCQLRKLYRTRSRAENYFNEDRCSAEFGAFENGSTK